MSIKWFSSSVLIAERDVYELRGVESSRRFDYRMTSERVRTFRNAVRLKCGEQRRIVQPLQRCGIVR